MAHAGTKRVSPPTFSREPRERETSRARRARGSTLWHGLLTVPLCLTEGLPKLMGLKKVPGRPSVSRSGTVGRPCHNTV